MSQTSQWSQLRKVAALPGTQPHALDDLHLRAYLEYAVGDFEESVAIISRAAQQSPNEPAYQFDLGLAAWRAGHTARAREVFAQSFALDTRFADAPYNAALMAMQLGETRAARGYFRAAIGSEPILAFRMLADLVRQFLFRRPPRLLERYGWRVPTKEYPAVLDMISMGLMKRGMPEEAARYLRRALKIEQTPEREARLAGVLEAVSK